MRIIVAEPPNIDEIRKVFTFTRTVIFTYDGAVYNPDDVYIDVPMMRHEEMHDSQQMHMGTKKWWDKYLKDPKFRSEQEKEAYRMQYYAYNGTDRNVRAKYAQRLAQALSGDTYGNCISFKDALAYITS